MNYSFTLKTVGITVGILLVVLHAVALSRPAEARRWLTGFPRSFRAGVVLLTIDLIWSFTIAYSMDWGEFYTWRVRVLCLLPIAYYLTIRYVDDFLSVRALGILALMAASPLLDSAFLHPQVSRLLLVVVAYVWVILGMFWIGQPHLLRDQIGWINRSTGRWRFAAGGGLAYGVVLLLCALTWY